MASDLLGAAATGSFDLITATAGMQVLVHLASGIGNLVLATPLLAALGESGLVVDVRLDADYAETIELFRNWSIIRRIDSGAFRGSFADYAHVLPAIPPFYWSRFAALYASVSNAVRRPPDHVFYENEQEYYLAFAKALGCVAESPLRYRLPIAPSERFGVSTRTVVLAPGCKTGEMAAKRWPYFPELAERIEDVVLVGTPDDLPQRPFPLHCRSFAGRLSLRETAELAASAGLVVGNDSGLSHMAAAVGTPTLMIFGPTSERVLGPLPPHVQIIRLGLPCEPCWTSARLRACDRRVDCLKQLSVDAVWDEIQRMQSETGSMA
jgi:ADP-heptose:LPS heptosyltransferase